MILAVALAFSGHAHCATSPEKETVPARSPAPLFEAFQLATYLKDQTVEDITDAIQTAWQLDPSRSGTTIRLKFHTGTQQLFVSDSKEAIEIVRRVVSQLRPVSPVPLPTLASNPIPADEARRLEAVAAEVRRRRALREDAAIIATATQSLPRPPATPASLAASVAKPAQEIAPLSPPPPLPPDPALSAEIQRRRETRSISGAKAPAPAPPEQK